MAPRHLRIAVVGAGAIGTSFAWIYQRAGLSVELIEKDPARVSSIRNGRFAIEMPGGDPQTLRIPIHTYPLPSLSSFDLVQISVKGFDSRRAAEDIRPLVSENTLLLSVQNGLGNLEILAGAHHPDRVVGGITAHSAQILDDERVRYAGGHGPLLAVGPWSHSPAPRLIPVLESFADALDRAGYEVHIVSDVIPVLWRKLIANTASNPVAALTGRTAAEMLASTPSRELAKLLTLESAAVARALGIAFPEIGNPWEYVRRGLEGVGHNKISMLQDVEAGRPTEIGTLNEALCREAERLGIPATANRVVSLLVRALEDRLGAEERAQPCDPGN